MFDANPMRNAKPKRSTRYWTIGSKEMLMRFALPVLILLCATSVAVAQQPKIAPPVAEPSMTTGAGRFDGTWEVTLICPTHTDGALGYTYRFFAQVKDGFLRGQHGTEGRPGWLTLDGGIQPDGSAQIEARGLTGDPNYSVDRVPKTTPYRYHATARFDGSRGAGSRVETRICNLSFVKQ
jgi:hypothetical protein